MCPGVLLKFSTLIVISTRLVRYNVFTKLPLVLITELVATCLPSAIFTAEIRILILPAFFPFWIPRSGNKVVCSPKSDCVYSDVTDALVSLTPQRHDHTKPSRHLRPLYIFISFYIWWTIKLLPVGG